MEELQVTLEGERRSYCLPLDELLAWFQEQGVKQQDWTQLDPRTWRLDGVDTYRKEHTVWIFQQVSEGVELVGYRDSDPLYADRDSEKIMYVYWPYIRPRSRDYVKQAYDDAADCQSPYPEKR